MHAREMVEATPAHLPTSSTRAAMVSFVRSTSLMSGCSCAFWVTMLLQANRAVEACRRRLDVRVPLLCMRLRGTRPALIATVANMQCMCCREGFPGRRPRAPLEHRSTAGHSTGTPAFLRALITFEALDHPQGIPGDGNMATQEGLYCGTAGAYFQGIDELQEHYRSDFHRLEKPRESSCCL